MPPKNSPQNDSKLLLAVAGVVVAGAVAVALVAGLTVEGDRESTSVTEKRQASQAITPATMISFMSPSGLKR